MYAIDLLLRLVPTFENVFFSVEHLCKGLEKHVCFLTGLQERAAAAFVSEAGRIEGLW